MARRVRKSTSGFRTVRARLKCVGPSLSVVEDTILAVIKLGQLPYDSCILNHFRHILFVFAGCIIQQNVGSLCYEHCRTHWPGWWIGWWMCYVDRLVDVLKLKLLLSGSICLKGYSGVLSLSTPSRNRCSDLESPFGCCSWEIISQNTLFTRCF